MPSPEKHSSVVAYSVHIGDNSSRCATGPDKLLTLFVGAPGSALLGASSILHANVGCQRNRVLSRTPHTWELSAEIVFSPLLSGIIETYGQEAKRPSRQIGLRFWVVPDRLQVDGTLGSQSGGSRGWTSLGIRALF